MKKLGYFFLSILPLLIAVGIQFVAMILLVIVCTPFTIMRTNHSITGIYNALSDLFTNTDFNACAMIIYSIIVISGFGIWYYRNLGGDFLPKPRTTFHPLHFVGILVLVPGTQFATSYLIAILSMIFPSWLEAYTELMETTGLSQNLTVFMLLYAVIAGPIAEELIFRGVSMRILRKAFPFWAANLIQAILFGVYHMNWLQGCYAAALGLALGYVCEKGGSIYLSIFYHILFNLWGTVVTGALENASINDVVLGVIMFLITAISIPAGCTLFHLGQTGKRNRVTEEILQSQGSSPSSL